MIVSTSRGYYTDSVGWWTWKDFERGFIRLDVPVRVHSGEMNCYEWLQNQGLNIGMRASVADGNAVYLRLFLLYLVLGPKSVELEGVQGRWMWSEETKVHLEPGRANCNHVCILSPMLSMTRLAFRIRWHLYHTASYVPGPGFRERRRSGGSQKSCVPSFYSSPKGEPADQSQCARAAPVLALPQPSESNKPTRASLPPCKS